LLISNSRIAILAAFVDLRGKVRHTAMGTAKILLSMVIVVLVVLMVAFSAHSAEAQTRVTTVTTVDTVRPGDAVRPGEIIDRTNASSVQVYLSPGSYALVTHGMPLRIVPSGRLDWPPPYVVATEKYSSQCSLGPRGTLHGYVAGLPFPLIDPNDPAIATKIIWNYTYRPMNSDDVDIRYPEIATYSPRNDVTPINYLVVGHMAIYNNVGRVEVPPIPTDPDALASGIRSKFAMFPFIEPSAMFGYGMLRYRYIDPDRADDIWMYNREARRLRRETESAQSDPIASPPTFGSGMGGGQFAGVANAPNTALANNLDSDSLFGFSANPANFTYRFLGERRMLAPVHTVEGACPNDDPLTCSQNWEIRRLYVVEADANPGTNMSIPRRVLYVDSEGWFIAASDQYDRDGALWKSLLNFVTYADRAAPDARVAIYPYRRFFQVGTIDANLQDGYTTVASMPGPGTGPDSWYINMGAVDQAFFTTGNLEVASNRP
jgi:uncharacterized protein DUF1329